jgi:energy-coupling factor transport system permease protein
MRSAIAYTPRPGPLQSASARAAIVYLGSFVVVAFLFSNPIVLAAAALGAAAAGCAAGAGRAVVAATRAGLVLAVLIAGVNALVTDRGVTVLARLGEFPLLGQVNVTAESLAAGSVIGLRIMAAMIACAVYSACVDPDRVLRLLRPVAGRSALTATLISRLVPVALGDAVRLREASQLRGPAAAPVGRGALARRLLAGSLDRAVDVAATLELRGYGLGIDCPDCAGDRSRHDRRFVSAGVVLTVAAAAALAGGAAGFDTYPSVEISTGPATLALACTTLAAGAVPLRRPRRLRPARRLEAAHA